MADRDQAKAARRGAARLGMAVFGWVARARAGMAGWWKRTMIRPVSDDRPEGGWTAAFWWLVASPFLAGAAVFLFWQPFFKPIYHEYKADRFLASARGFFERGDLASSRIQLANAVRHEPNRAESWELLAEILRREGSPERAGALAMAAARRIEDAKLVVESLRICMEEGRPDAGAQLARAAAAAHPENAEIQHRCGIILFKLGDLTTSYRMLARARQLAPGRNEFELAVASVQAQYGDDATAARGRARLEVLRADPQWRGLAARAIARSLAGREPARAAALFEEVLREDAKDWNARMGWLECRVATERERTAEWIDQAWAGAGELGQKLDLVVKAGQLLNAEAAGALLARLTDAERHQPETLLVLSEMLAGTGRWRHLEGMVREMIQTQHPAWRAEPLRFSIALGLAQLHLGGEAAASGRAVLKDVLQKVKGDPLRAWDVGVIIERWGRLEEALPFYTAADDPAFVNQFAAKEKLVMIHGKRGNMDDVRRICEEILEADPDNLGAQNNVAAALVISGSDPRRALALTEAPYAAKAGELAVADTRARALMAMGRATEAVAIYKALPERERNLDAIRVHHAGALILVGNRREAEERLMGVDFRNLRHWDLRLFHRHLAELGVAAPEAKLK